MGPIFSYISASFRSISLLVVPVDTWQYFSQNAESDTPGHVCRNFCIRKGRFIKIQRCASSWAALSSRMTGKNIEGTRNGFYPWWNVPLMNFAREISTYHEGAELANCKLCLLQRPSFHLWNIARICCLASDGVLFWNAFINSSEWDDRGENRAR